MTVMLLWGCSVITASSSLRKGKAPNKINCQVFYGLLKCSRGTEGHGVSPAYVGKMLDVR